MKKIPELHICPSCGGFKSPESKQCRACYLASLGSSSRRTRHRKDACPRCGKPKLKASRLCMSCSMKRKIETLPGLPDRKKPKAKEPNWDSLVDDWLYYFVGLFLSEGTVRLHLNRGGTLSVQMSMKLRADDLLVIEDIFSHLGGSVHISFDKKKKGLNPTANWSLTFQDHVWKVLVLLRPFLAISPARKIKEVDLALEYLEWRHSVPFLNLDRKKCQEFHGRDKALRVYVEPDLSKYE